MSVPLNKQAVEDGQFKRCFACEEGRRDSDSSDDRTCRFRIWHAVVIKAALAGIIYLIVRSATSHSQ